MSPHTHICGFCCSVLWSLLSRMQRRASHVFLSGFFLNVLCKRGLQQPATAITLNQKDEEGKAWRCFTSLHIRLDSPCPPGSSINIYALASDPTGRHVLCLVLLVKSDVRLRHDVHKYSMGRWGKLYILLEQLEL